MWLVFSYYRIYTIWLNTRVGLLGKLVTPATPHPRNSIPLPQNPTTRVPDNEERHGPTTDDDRYDGYPATAEETGEGVWEEEAGVQERGDIFAGFVAGAT